MTFRILLLALTLGTAVLAASLGVLEPVDEAGKDPSFLAFRTKLLAVVQKRDVAGLKAIVDAKIDYSFGADPPGWAGFKKFFEPERPDSEFWGELAKVLSHGGAFMKDGGFQAPYYSARWPDDLDPFQNGAILGEDVKIRAQADPGAKPVAELSYNLVEVAEAGPEWVKIKLPQGGVGYVARSDYGSPVDYRAFFEKTSGQWKMTTFIAGD